MVTVLWNEWAPDGITAAEVDKTAAAFVKGMKAATYKQVRMALELNMIGALKSVWVENKGADGAIGLPLTSARIVDTTRSKLDSQPDAAMRGLATRMFSRALGPAKHSMPVGEGETEQEMTYVQVYDCDPTAPWLQVLQPVVDLVLEEIELHVQAHVVQARRRTKGHTSANKNDPEGYSTFAVCKAFIEDVFASKEGGGGAERDALVRNKFWESFMEFGLEHLGEIPDKDDILSFEDGIRYLKPYLFDDEEGNAGGSGGSPDDGAGNGGDGAGNDGDGAGSDDDGEYGSDYGGNRGKGNGNGDGEYESDYGGNRGKGKGKRKGNGGDGDSENESDFSCDYSSGKRGNGNGNGGDDGEYGSDYGGNRGKGNGNGGDGDGDGEYESDYRGNNGGGGADDGGVSVGA